MSTAISLLISILAPILTMIVKSFTDKLTKASKVGESNEQKRSYYDEFNSKCLAAVRRVDIELAGLRPSKDYKLTAEQAVEAKQKAHDYIKNSYGLDGLTELAMFFDTDALGLENIINLHIEASLAEVKKAT